MVVILIDVGPGIGVELGDVDGQAFLPVRLRARRPWMMPVAKAGEVLWSGPQLDLMSQRVASTVSSISMTCAAGGGMPPPICRMAPPMIAPGI